MKRMFLKKLKSFSVYIIRFVALILVLSIPITQYFFFFNKDFSSYKDPGLEYSWGFNKDLGPGGRTYNASYFEMSEHSLLCELIYCIYDYQPYHLMFKHEEAHILTLKLRNKTELYNWGDKFSNDNYDRALYFNRINEGLAEYYTYNYHNGAFATHFKKYLWLTNKRNHRYDAYIEGRVFVEYLLENGFYDDLNAIIDDIASEKQLKMFLMFMNSTDAKNIV